MSNALSILRLFSEANFSHKLVNSVHEFGRDMVRKKEFICLRNENENITYCTEMIDNIYLNIDNKFIGYLERGFISDFNRLLCIEQLNKFQENLLNALLIYSKHVIRHEVYDKLLYLLVALESILLRNDNEPIQQNVGERLAFLVGETVAERIEIIAVLKNVYTIRSKFIHHGKIDITEDELITKFMMYTWLCFAKLVSFFEKFKTNDELIKCIEELKLS